MNLPVTPSADFIVYLDAVFALIGVGVLPVVYRITSGPTLVDRLLAGELAATLVTFMFALVGVRAGNELYLDAALLLALLAFISTVSIAQMESGRP